jgi:hypothetical protein
MTPLLERGFSLFKLKHKGQETFTVTDNEAPYFKSPIEHEGETVSEVETRLVIVAPSFNLGNKWRVSDGGRTIYVSILDEMFERSVQQGTEEFRKGDTLHVTLRTTQWLDEGKLQADFSIVKVHRHDHGSKQQALL